MILTNEEKQAIQKYAEVIGCDWFEFAIDDYGDFCVFDKEENKKMKLSEGIRELANFNNDAESVFLIYNSFEIVANEGKLYVYDKLEEKKLKPSCALRQVFSRFDSVEKINNALTIEQKDLCLKVISRARMEKRFCQERLINILRNAIVEIELLQNGKSILETGVIENLGLRKYEYNTLLEGK